MLAEPVSKNQLTLPRAVAAAVEATDDFDVTAENGHIVSAPVHVNRADEFRAGTTLRAREVEPGR